MEYRKFITGLNERGDKKKKLQSYYKTKVPKSFGRSGGSSIFSADLANQYIIMLVKEIYTGTGDINMVSEGIFTDLASDSFNAQSDLLAKAYAKAHGQKNIKGVYTVWSAQGMKEQAHQNWLFFDIKKKEIIRMEPNGNGTDEFLPQFRMKEFMDTLTVKVSREIKERVSWRLALDEVSINNFDGCRATSTILATMHVLGIDFDYLEKIEFTEAYPDTTKALAYILHKGIKECRLPEISRRRTRSQKELNLVSPI